MAEESRARSQDASKTGGVLETFLIFLRLGLVSFGGPIAHLGYYREEFVQRRRWLDDRAYADLVALSQFLPGPASSQTGFAIGLMRAGTLGGIAAWVGFTLPSAILMVGFAYGLAVLEGPAFQGLVHGLKLVAVAVVAHALLGMYRTLCPDRERATIAVAAAVLVVLMPTIGGQIMAIVGGGLLWLFTGRDDEAGKARHTVRRQRFGPGAGAALITFFVLLLGLPVVADDAGGLLLGLADAFYRAGSLVFGGGHVVLPLLEAEVVPRGWVDEDTFLSGYGAAQALPGPLFTFAAYVGTLATDGGLPGAFVALAAIFLPGLLLIYGTLPVWDRLRENRHARRVLAGVNAAVVGILAAALYRPLWTSSVETSIDFVAALVGFLLLAAWRWPSWSVVLLLAGLGLVFGFTGVWGTA